MNDIYEGSNESTTTENQEPAQAPAFKLPDEAAGLIGPGKKYASVEAALAALPHAQQHISKLEEENGQLRGSVQQTQTVEEVYAAVKELLVKEGQPSRGLDEASVAGLIDSRLQAAQAAQAAAANEQSFKSVMSAQFGDAQGKVFAEKAAEVGLTTKELSDMVRRSPQAALRLIGVDAKTQARKPLQSTVNTDALANNTPLQQERKNVMQGSTTKDLVNAWRAAAPKTE